MTAGNKIYVDSTGSLTEARTIVSCILFTPDTANDQIVLRESASGPDVFMLRGSTGKNTVQFDFSIKPVVFPNGIYVQTLTSGAKAVIITTQAGGS